RVQRLEDLAAKLVANGGEAVALALDLAVPASVDQFAADAAEALGPVDVLISNAGEVVPLTGVGADPDAFTASVQVNLLGAQRLVTRLGPDMVGRGHGDIVFVTSDVVVRPRTHMAAYVTAKWGLEGLARAMQMELEGTGVRVGMVRPGPASTEQGTAWTEEVVQEVVESWSAWGHLRHSGALRPKDVAAAVMAMVSTPKGTHLSLVEVQPEAPVEPGHSQR
ncbi:MAG: SDR family NAD(P)-dependent oxidoreductase, partial [Actinomycetota bacterium]|nr:SDR family NAD(P)-dependent oxidoreductase [Actinomycetota bacterium]